MKDNKVTITIDKFWEYESLLDLSVPHEDISALRYDYEGDNDDTYELIVTITRGNKITK